jgi:SAM-dependent methyltransferase
MDINELNRDGWNRRVAEKDHWTLPVSPETIRRARAGDWSVLLTSSTPAPKEWFGPLQGRDLLALASGGGQQAPVFAAAGANVTVLDASSEQLANDRLVAEREGLELRTVQGYMHDLSCFEDESFDLIFHPVSNCYAPDVLPVWREAFRVLRPGGALLAGFMAPASYIFDPLAEDDGELIVRFPLPYSDVHSQAPEDRDNILREFHTFEFSHTLQDQIGGQLAAGFLLAGFYEDVEPNRLLANFMPDLMATRAIKP